MKKSNTLTSIAIFICILFILPAITFASSGMSIYKKYIQQESKAKNLSKKMIMQLEVYSNGMTSKSTLYKKGKKMRLETITVSKDKTKKFKTTMINDGTTIATCSPITGLQTFPNTEDEEEQQYEEHPLSVKRLGYEKIENITCHKLEVVDQKNETSILWIAKKNYSLIKQKFKYNNSEVVNLNFKRIHGINFPMKSQQFANNKVTETTIIKSVKFNAYIPEYRFKIASLKCEHKGIKNMGEIFKKAQKLQERHQNGNDDQANELANELQGLFQ